MSGRKLLSHDDLSDLTVKEFCHPAKCGGELNTNG